MGENLPKVPGDPELRSDTLSRPVRTLRVKMVLLGALVWESPAWPCGAYVTQVVHLREVTLRFEIWDTAGEEKYHSVTPLYYRGAHAALLVYDISKRDTFIRAQVWLRELEKQYVSGSTVLDISPVRGQVEQLLLGVAHRVCECVGAQQGALSEWKDTPHVDLCHRNTFNSFASCCKREAQEPTGAGLMVEPSLPGAVDHREWTLTAGRLNHRESDVEVV
ncbi:hypothetical protein F7725_001493, partial [Dissostichus mawsoni]